MQDNTIVHDYYKMELYLLYYLIRNKRCGMHFLLYFAMLISNAIYEEVKKSDYSNQRECEISNNT